MVSHCSPRYSATKDEPNKTETDATWISGSSTVDGAPSNARSNQ